MAEPPDPQRTEADEPTPRGAPAARSELGRYRLLEELGRGGMGVVYRALDVPLQREVALKTLLLSGPPSPVAMERLLREARTAAALDHPGIVPIHDVGVVDGVPYLAMACLRGRTFEQALEAGEPAGVRERARVVTAAAEAVAYAHERRVIHRDLKPANLFLDHDGRVHVMDFGLACSLDEATRLTSTGQAVGTPRYMSPEQMEADPAAVGPPSDVWALGAILYRALTGRPPFEGSTVAEVMHRTLFRDPDPPRRIDARIPTDLETICLKSLEKDPARRYADARALADDLRRYLDGEAIAARPVSAIEILLRRARRHRVAAATTVLAALCIAGALGYARIASEERRREAEERRRAEVAAADARRALDKAGRVQRVLARWQELNDTLARLDAAHHDSTRNGEEKRARAAESWPPVEAFLRATPADDVSRAAALALAGWARRLAGHEEEGFAWMRQATAQDEDLPYGPLLEAAAEFGAYVAEQPVPSVNIGAQGLQFSPPAPESAEQAQRRLRLEERVARAAAAPVWGEGLARDFRLAVEAMAAMQAGRPEEAERRLTAALESAALRAFQPDFRFARARARYLLRLFGAGLADVEEVLRAHPDRAEAWFFAGVLHLAAGVERMARGVDPREDLARAIERLDGALRRRRTYPEAWFYRAVAHMKLGEAGSARGEDPRDAFRQAAEDADRALEFDPGYAQACNARGCARLLEALSLETYGLDPEPLLAAAIADFGLALERTPGDATAIANRCTAHLRLGRLRAGRGQDPADAFAKAVADAGAALQQDPAYAPAWFNRGCVHASVAYSEVQQGVDPRPRLEMAVADFTEALARDPDYREAHRVRGEAFRDLAEAESALGADPVGSFVRAAEDFAVVLAARPDALEVRLARAWVLERLGRVAEAAREYEIAMRGNGGISPAIESSLVRVRARLAEDRLGLPAGWTDRALRAVEHMREGAYESARAIYEPLVASVGEQAAGDDAIRPLLTPALYNLACIYSLRSEGRTGPDVPAAPPSPTEAAAWRDRAFAHLQRALDAGFRDLAMMLGDQDLAPLRGDPRWHDLTGKD